MAACGRSTTVSSSSGWWVPQGSVLGLSAVHGGLESHDLGPHTWAYADSTRIYGSCRPTAAARLQMPMSACIDEVALWMRSNRLQVNTGKRRRCHCEPWVDSSTHQHGSATTTCRATCESPLTVTYIGVFSDQRLLTCRLGVPLLAPVCMTYTYTYNGSFASSQSRQRSFLPRYSAIFGESVALLV